MSNIFFTSDTHFFHNNVINYCNRPFEDIHHMNAVLVNEWNAIVKPDDTIYHLGDFSFCPRENVVKLLSQLNGNKWLVYGNHDDKRVRKAEGWYGVTKDLVFIFDHIRYQCCHHPNLDHFKDWDVFLYGHKHGAIPTHNTLDVGVDNAAKLLGSYRPFSLDEIAEILSKAEAPA